MSQLVGETTEAIDLEEQRRQIYKGKPRRSGVRQPECVGGKGRGGQRGDDELPVVVETGDPVAGGEDRLKGAQRGVQVSFELGEAELGIGRCAGQLAELLA